MDRNSGIKFLIGLFAIGTLAAMILAFIYSRSNGELRRVQAQIPRLENNRAIAQQLASDVMEYSKTHPAVNPILESVGMKPASATPTK
jgi:hypothetical protein